MFFLFFIFIRYSFSAWFLYANSSIPSNCWDIDFPTFSCYDNVITIFGGQNETNGVHLTKIDFSGTAKEPDVTPFTLSHIYYGSAHSSKQTTNYNLGGIDHETITNQFMSIENDNETLLTNVNGPSNRTDATMIYDDNNFLFLFGGRNDLGLCDSVLYVYDIPNSSWESLNPKSKPSCRYGAAGAYQASGKFLLIFGGKSLNGEVLGDLWKYDVLNRIWTSIGTTGPILKRYFHTAHFLGNTFIVHGGYKIGDKVAGVSGDTLFLDMDAKNLEWTMAKYESLSRFKHASFIINETYLVVVGGTNHAGKREAGLSVLNLRAVEKTVPGYENIPEVNPLMYLSLVVPILVSIIFPFILCLASYREGMVITTFQQTMEGVGIRPGVPPDILSHLPTKPYHKAECDHDTCPICLIEFIENEEIKELPCLHLFHPTCVDTWLNVSQLCPMCKNSVVAPDNDVETQARREFILARNYALDILSNADVDPSTLRFPILTNRPDFEDPANPQNVFSDATASHAQPPSTIRVLDPNTSNISDSLHHISPHYSESSSHSHTNTSPPMNGPPRDMSDV